MPTALRIGAPGWRCRRAPGIVLLLMLAACAGRVPPPQPPTPPSAASVPALAALGIARAQVGTPYRYGGADPATGFDCSGLVAYSYGAAGVSLPRSVRGLRAAVAPLARTALTPGDLVFFRIGRGQEHVGIYAGEGVFVHAPSAGGAVRRERLEDPYWAMRYLAAGRVAAR
jgi:cell wall-associated NlpC family hydrolase